MTIIRVVVAGMMVIHGVTRIRLNLIHDFGVFLSGFDIPMATVFAWIVTMGEILGGSALALGLGVVWLCGWFAVQLTLGIVMVHAREGWFVVDAGRNGMEYSVVLIAALASIALMHDSRAPGVAGLVRKLTSAGRDLPTSRKSPDKQ